MKLNLKRFQSFFIALGFLLIALLLVTNYDSGRRNVTFQSEDLPDINDSTTYARFKQLTTQTEQIREWKKSRLKTHGVRNGFIDVREVTECDSCNNFFDDDDYMNYRDKYFFVLPGYFLDDNAAFFIEKDKYFLYYSVWDVVHENGRSGHRETKEIPVRFAFDSEKSDSPGDVLLPISKSTYKLLNIPFTIIYILLALFLFYVLFIIPAGVLYTIADGDFFTRNISGKLLWTGWGLVGLSLITPFLSILLNLAFQNKIPDELVYPFFDSILRNKATLIGGIAVLLLARAFRKGEKLQQEQDLTV